MKEEQNIDDMYTTEVCATAGLVYLFLLLGDHASSWRFTVVHWLPQEVNWKELNYCSQLLMAQGLSCQLLLLIVDDVESFWSLLGMHGVLILSECNKFASWEPGRTVFWSAYRWPETSNALKGPVKLGMLLSILVSWYVPPILVTSRATCGVTAVLVLCTPSPSCMDHVCFQDHHWLSRARWPYSSLEGPSVTSTSPTL